MMILDRYLITRTLAWFLVVTLVFIAVFAAHALALKLSLAASGFVKSEFVMRMIAMKIVIALDVILPIALYTAVFLALARFQQSGKTTAMLAAGYGSRDVARGLVPLFAFVAVLVALSSVAVRPRTYRAYYRLRSRAEAAFDYRGIEPNRFYVGSEGNRVVHADGVDGDFMTDVFIWTRSARGDLIIRASRLIREEGKDAEATLRTQDLRVYEKDANGWALRGEAGALTTSVDFGGLAATGYKRKAAATRALAGSRLPEDIAELQWRLSRPLGAFLMGFLALRVAAFARRLRHRLAAAVFVISVCLVYYLATLAARSWVKDGVVGGVPGMWWVDLGLLAFLAAPLFVGGRGVLRS